MDLQNVVEIGCGRGRHAAQCLDQIGRITLVDINEANIAACRERFRDRTNVAFLRTEGGTLVGVEDGMATAVFSYDAMVHFEASDVISYIFETHRILRSGGRALFHYSNYDQNPGGFYRDNPGHRNFFSERMMRHFADRSGFKVVKHTVFSWSGSQVLSDAMVLLQS
jgi:ubiquinone/menaquinone biosynthesis C-methylase UbiE